MFGMFDGYGTELATALWTIFVPLAIALARWYANYRALGTKVVELEKDLDECSKKCAKFEQFIVAYNAYQKGRNNEPLGRPGDTKP